jgi:hypothetical protein
VFPSRVTRVISIHKFFDRSVECTRGHSAGGRLVQGIGFGIDTMQDKELDMTIQVEVGLTAHCHGVPLVTWEGGPEPLCVRQTCRGSSNVR